MSDLRSLKASIVQYTTVHKCKILESSLIQDTGRRKSNLQESLQGTRGHWFDLQKPLQGTGRH